MADRRKNKVKDKSPTVITKEPKKKKGREKKPTLNLSGGLTAPKNENEKEQAKPVKIKTGKGAPIMEPVATAPEEKPVAKPALEILPIAAHREPKREQVLPEQPQGIPAQAAEKPAPVVEKDEPKREEAKVQASKASLSRRVKVLFVCTGNTCRSAMAQYIFADFLKGKGEEGNVDVSGAGLSAFNGDDMSEQAKEALIERGIFGVNHFARRLTRDMVERADLVVCMTESHARAIGGAPNVTTIARITGGADVADPWGGTLDDYRKVAAYLRYACDDIYDALVKISNRA